LIFKYDISIIYILKLNLKLDINSNNKLEKDL
jgi:hypothetical protein